MWVWTFPIDRTFVTRQIWYAASTGTVCVCPDGEEVCGCQFKIPADCECWAQWVWPVGNKDGPSDQSWDLSLGIPRDVYHPPSLLGCIRAGNKSLSDSRLSSSDWEHYQPHHQPSVSLCPPPPSPGPCTGLSMPQLKLHSSQSSFQDNKFDARRSSLCAGVFTQICRCRGAAG